MWCMSAEHAEVVVQAVQHREAAQLLADQGLTGCLLAMAAWMVAPDGGGAPALLTCKQPTNPLMGFIDAPVILWLLLVHIPAFPPSLKALLPLERRFVGRHMT